MENDGSLGLGLADVRRVLAGQASIAEVAAAHRDALDAQTRAYQHGFSTPQPR